MDLRAIINNEAGEDKAAAAVAQQPATPSSSSQHPQSRHANRLYTEYSNSSAGRQTQHDVARNSASYDYDQGRSLSRNTSASGDYRQQSRTPHEQFASPTAAYQRPQLHLPGSSIQRQESYPQPSASQYLTSPVPSTPPSAIGPSGAYPPYLQQQHSRSLSSQHSNSTPTSAQSQYNQSPLLASAYPGPAYLQQRQSPHQGRQPIFQPPQLETLRREQSRQEHERLLPEEQTRILGYDGQDVQSQSLLAQLPNTLQRRMREQSESVSPRTTPVTRVPPKDIRREPSYVAQPQQLKPRGGRESEPPVQRRRTDEMPDMEGETTTEERSPEQQRQAQNHETNTLEIASAPYDQLPPSSFSPVKRGAQSQTPQPQQQNKRPQSEDSQVDGERPRKRKRYTQDTMPIWARSWPEFVKFKKMYPDGKFHGVPVASIGGPLVQDEGSAQPQVNDNAVQQPHTNGGPGPTSAPPPPGDDLSALLGLTFSPNISGITPPAPITKQIADFLYVTVIARNDWNQLMAHKIVVEVEAKLGTLIDKSTNQRLELPIASEAVLTHGMSSKVAFRSEMQEEVFKKGNNFLNDATRQALATPARVEYKHRKEVDSFHHLPASKLNELPPAMQSILNTPATRNRGLKVRVSHDQKTGKELARIVKARVADLDVYFPTSQLDCRISVNLEMEFDGDLPIDSGIKKAPNDDEGDRRKDRMSYKQSGYTIDLTQVLSSNAPPTHELEIEIDTDILVEQGRRLGAGEKSGYVEFVEGLVNRMKSLVGELGE